MDYYAQCVSIADKEANIENAGERYYSSKAKCFQEVLKRELYKKKIKYFYSTYEAYYVHLDKCKSLLEHFGEYNREQLVDSFNKEFSDMIVENAGIRFDKNKTKYLLNKSDYLLSFENLCEITVDNKTEYLYRKWMVVDKEYANQFMKYLILPCDYHLTWVETDGKKRVKRKMWTVLRNQNS